LSWHVIFQLLAQGGLFQKGGKDDVYYSDEKKTDTNAIPKKAWKILIKNNLTADENFALVGRTLAENDFTIDTKDKEFFTIKSGTKDVGKVSGRYFFTFSVRDNVISVTGQTNSDVSLSFGYAKSESSFEKIANRGAKLSYIGISFARMNEFALKLGPTVEYITADN